MPASIDRIRDNWNMQTTPQDKGLKLTITVVAYDNGIIQLDGVPISQPPGHDQAEGWLVTAETALATLVEFRKDVVKRQKQKGA